MFESKAKINDTIAIWYGGKWNYNIVNYIEPLPPSNTLLHDFGSISNGSSVTNVKLSFLDMNTDELGEFRLKVLDDIKIKFSQPTVSGRFITKSSVVELDKYSAMFDASLKLSTIYVFEDGHPLVDVTNDSGVDLTKSRIIAMGYRYALTEIEEEEVEEVDQWIVAAGYGLKT